RRRADPRRRSDPPTPELHRPAAHSVRDPEDERSHGGSGGRGSQRRHRREASPAPDQSRDPRGCFGDMTEVEERDATVSKVAGDSELRAMSAVEIAANVNARRLSAEEVVLAHLEAIERSADLHAFITVAAERALDRARSRPRGPLAGVPLVPKDMFDTAGIRTTRGSAVFAHRVPRTTAASVARLEAAGAVVIGKANQHEFAWGVTSQNPHWGDVRNPRRPTRTPGGSSGGNAAALAAHLCALGLGTDTGGSVRIPSACCGTVGFKPSKGKIDMRGCFPLAPSFDTIGPMA